ncbi:MAG: hypothetical protein HGA85_00135 [Nanoarchaeota archaeon]|nr:hypothetical protein [Nanoarchaeota archaeon]
MATYNSIFNPGDGMEGIFYFNTLADARKAHAGLKEIKETGAGILRVLNCDLREVTDKPPFAAQIYYFAHVKSVKGGFTATEAKADLDKIIETITAKYN